jgi:xanthine dehydrogenase YagR molybdenum-binding subunit
MTDVVTRSKLLGDPVDRVDGPLKVTGAAPYPSDVTYPGLAHAALAQSTIAAGTISRIDIAAARAAPGVLAVITHENAPALADAPMTPLGPSPRFPLQDNRILHHGQHVAIVVARTREQAAAAARLITIDDEETPRYWASTTRRRRFRAIRGGWRPSAAMRLPRFLRPR